MALVPFMAAAEAALVTATFAPAAEIPLSGAIDPHGLLVADVNKDGVRDVVTANQDSNNVSVLLGRGDGTFAANANYPVDGPWRVAVADLNRDDNPDLIAGNCGVSVLLGRGDGTFGATRNFSDPRIADPRQCPGVGASLAVADFNRDAKLDVAAVTRSRGGWMLWGRGDGTFEAADPNDDTFGLGGGPGYSQVAWGVAVGDVNKDGNPDLVTANDKAPYGSTGSWEGDISVLRGTGGTVASGFVRGAYRTGERWDIWDKEQNFGFAPALNTYAVALGDISGDGRLDVITANRGANPSSVSVVIGEGDGTFPLWRLNGRSSPRIYGLDGSPLSVAIGDLNGDGKPTWSPPTSPHTVPARRGGGRLCVVGKRGRDPPRRGLVWASARPGRSGPR